TLISFLATICRGSPRGLLFFSVLAESTRLLKQSRFRLRPTWRSLRDSSRPRNRPARGMRRSVSSPAVLAHDLGQARVRESLDPIAIDPDHRARRDERIDYCFFGRLDDCGEQRIHPRVAEHLHALDVEPSPAGVVGGRKCDKQIARAVA